MFSGCKHGEGALWQSLSKLQAGSEWAWNCWMPASTRGQEQLEDETRNVKDPTWVNTWCLKHMGMSGLILFQGEMLGNLLGKRSGIQNVIMSSDPPVLHFKFSFLSSSTQTMQLVSFSWRRWIHNVLDLSMWVFSLIANLKLPLLDFIPLVWALTLSHLG